MFVQLRYCRWFVFVCLVDTCCWLPGLSSDTVGGYFGTGFVMLVVVLGLVSVW